MRWLVWSLYVILWTIALEIPVRTPTNVPGAEFIITNKILFAKTLHVLAYTGMTLLTAWAAASSRFRPLLMFFLMAHACGTELMQEALQEYCHRGGSVRDVAFDALGIAIGIALSWRRWTRD